MLIVSESKWTQKKQGSVDKKSQSGRKKNEKEMEGFSKTPQEVYGKT